MIMRSQHWFHRSSLYQLRRSSRNIRFHMALRHPIAEQAMIGQQTRNVTCLALASCCATSRSRRSSLLAAHMREALRGGVHLQLDRRHEEQGCHTASTSKHPTRVAARHEQTWMHFNSDSNLRHSLSTIPALSEFRNVHSGHIRTTIRLGHARVLSASSCFSPFCCRSQRSISMFSKSSRSRAISSGTSTLSGSFGLSLGPGSTMLMPRMCGEQTT